MPISAILFLIALSVFVGAVAGFFIKGFMDERIEERNINQKKKADATTALSELRRKLDATSQHELVDEIFKIERILEEWRH